jgi:GNAT superfamily N-acetyltransferase
VAVAIRRLVPSDAPVYRALRLRGLDEHPDAFTSSADEERAKPLAWTEARLAPDGNDVVYGAFDDEALVGVVGLGREARAKNRHKAVVFGMFVAAERVGHGVGSALLAYAIAEARAQRGLEQLVLTVTASNGSARKLYVQHGFRSFGVEPRAIRVDGRYFDKDHMILFLNAP